MQNDFIDGSLGTKEATQIVGNVKAKIERYRDCGYEVIFTRDTHHENYMDTNDGKHLPVVHCIEGTDGWQIRDGLVKEGELIIDKPSFGYMDWSKYSFEEVELVGLCTDICVVSNALLLRRKYPAAQITVVAKACAGLSEEKHKAALEVMKSCLINIEED